MDKRTLAAELNSLIVRTYYFDVENNPCFEEDREHIVNCMKEIADTLGLVLKDLPEGWFEGKLPQFHLPEDYKGVIVHYMDTDFVAIDEAQRIHKMLQANFPEDIVVSLPDNAYLERMSKEDALKLIDSLREYVLGQN